MKKQTFRIGDFVKVKLWVVNHGVSGTDRYEEHIECVIIAKGKKCDDIWSTKLFLVSALGELPSWYRGKRVFEADSSNMILNNKEHGIPVPFDKEYLREY